MYTIKISSRRKKFIGPHVLEDLIEPGTSQGTRTLNPWQNPEPMMTTHLKRDNERKMGVGGLGQPTESADASNRLYGTLYGSNPLKKADLPFI